MNYKNKSIHFFLLLTTVGFWLSAGNLPNPGGLTYGPSLFPKALSFFLFFTLIFDFFNKDNQTKTIKISNKKRIKFYFIIFIVVFYYLSVEKIGFILTSFLCLSSLFLILGVNKKTTILVTLSTILTAYFIFSIILRVPLPSGYLNF